MRFYQKMDMKTVAGHLFIVSVLAVLLFVVNGCTMTQAEYNEWERIMKKQNAFYEESIERIKAETRDENERIHALEEQKSFLEERGQLLERENKMLQEQWGQARSFSRDATANVMAQIIESQDIFFDVRLGNPPHELEYPSKLPSGTRSIFDSSSYIALIDMENTIKEDSMLQGVEVYSSKGPHPAYSNEFYLAVYRVNQNNGEYYAVGLSHPLRIGKKGLNTYSFLYAPVEAKAGDRYGLLLAPGTSIDYDEVDLGLVNAVPLKNSFTGKMSSIQFSSFMPAKRSNNQQPGTRSFAFSILGTTVREYIFLFNVANRCSASSQLKSVDIDFRSISGSSEAVFNTYVAVFRFSMKTNLLELVALSDRMSIKAGDGPQKYPLYKNGTDGIPVLQGDMLALVFSPGMRKRDLAFPEKKFKILERDFNPIAPKCSLLFRSIPDEGSKDAAFKVEFSVK